MNAADELAEVGEELDLVFLEDDAYGDLIFDGDRPPALYAIAGRERVIKLGTLSKLVAGGMRLGWAIAEPDDISRMCGLKADSATGPFAAWVTGAYLQSGALARRLPTLLDLYRTRRDAMLEELDARFAKLGCDWITPAGGFFIWLELPEGADSEAIRERAEENGVTYLAGHHCFADGLNRRYIRLAYSYIPEDQLRQGTRRLVQTLRAELPPSGSI